MSDTVKIAAENGKGRARVIYSTETFAMHKTTGICDRTWTVTHRNSGFAAMKHIPNIKTAIKLTDWYQATFDELHVADFGDSHNLGIAAGDNWKELKERCFAKRAEIFGGEE